MEKFYLLSISSVYMSFIIIYIYYVVTYPFLMHLSLPILPSIFFIYRTYLLLSFVFLYVM
ncbi:hypothetical protein HanIR_Chr03g0142001 [Helianthus annuus]|nr:hypothetical protein HanIR_Chr03g0142001 [Helianthus annuus]